MKHTIIALGLVLAASTAHAGEMLTPGEPYCTGLGWTWKGIKCADVAASAKAFANDVKRFEKMARTARTPDLAARYRNRAAYSRLEAERLADKWRRKYGAK